MQAKNRADGKRGLKAHSRNLSAGSPEDESVRYADLCSVSQRGVDAKTAARSAVTTID
jgi:hypothetical protein